ncbi:hypothetical protein MUK42_22639 [Musa troglodytarum]|uniref:Complex III subunit VI n=1 Tax=Musa troglodytarum TaxID=320322 RepID=A0A9E7FVC4_9LILI|nr:hypothetical protein MUK42_22639 [Musa troglodytarum]
MLLVVLRPWKSKTFSGSRGFAFRFQLVPHLIHQVLQTIMADEEPVDPKQYLEETCKPKCVRPLRAYQLCVERIKEDETGHKHCTGQYFDYWKCVDNCVSILAFLHPSSGTEISGCGNLCKEVIRNNSLETTAMVFL